MLQREVVATAVGIFVVLLALLLSACSDSSKAARTSPTGSPQPSPARKAATSDPAACPTVVGLPGDLVITPPTTDASPDAAAFAGSWEGIWDWNGGKLPVRLVVTNVEGNKVALVYAWGTGPGATPGYSRASDIEVEGGRIEVGRPEMIFTFALDSGGRSLSAQIDVRNQILKATLRECKTLPARP